MRRAFSLGTALLAACVANPPAAPAQAIPVHGVTPGHKCVASGSDRFIGQPGTSKTGAAIKRATKAAVLRWSPPNTMLTMDYREDRVTVWLDQIRKVTKIRCG